MSEKRGSDVRHMGYAVAEREYRAFISVEEHVEESSGLSQATLDFFSGSMYEPIEEEIGAQNKTRVLISGTGAELTNMDIIEFFGDDHR